MDIKILKLEERSIKFIISGVTPAFANALRRSMIAEVPTLAIDEVNIYENTSVLFDEILALRIGLIPLKSDLDSYRFPNECDCENGCPQCQVSLTLSAEGPRIVYSGDLQSSDPKVVPADPNIPIVELKDYPVKNGIRLPPQKIVLEAIARLGQGKDHAKWQPAVACGYKNLPKIIISEKCDACGACISECPRHLLTLNGKLKVINEVECSLCKLCEEACEIKAIKVEVDKNSFVFSLESDGSLTITELVTRAADILKQKAKEFSQSLKAIE